jgi:hypothetical protein
MDLACQIGSTRPLEVTPRYEDQLTAELVGCVHSPPSVVGSGKSYAPADPLFARLRRLTVRRRPFNFTLCTSTSALYLLFQLPHLTFTRLNRRLADIHCFTHRAC